MPEDSLRQRILDRYRERMDSMPKAMAKAIGQPVNSHKLTEAEQAQYWLFRARPESPEDLIAQGMPPAQAVDAIFPHRNKLIGPGAPSQRVERAEALAKLAERYLGQQQPEQDMVEPAMSDPEVM